MSRARAEVLAEQAATIKQMQAQNEALTASFKVHLLF